MSLSKQLAEYISACFTGLWVNRTSTRMPSRNRRRCAARRTGGWPSGTSNRACNSRPATHSRRRRWQRSAGGHPRPQRPGQSRQFSHPRAANFHRFLASRRRSSRPWPSRSPLASSNRPSWSSCRPWFRCPSNWRSRSRSSNTSLPGRDSLKRSPAAWPPSRANCPRGRNWTGCWTPPPA